MKNKTIIFTLTNGTQITTAIYDNNPLYLEINNLLSDNLQNKTIVIKNDHIHEIITGNSISYIRIENPELNDIKNLDLKKISKMKKIIEDDIKLLTITDNDNISNKD